MEEKKDGFSAEELEVVELPKREAMSLANVNLHVNNLLHNLFKV
jgi:hypothetical protein